MASIEIIKTGETITLGRKDYGWGVTAELVTVDGDVFATYGGRYYSQCGMCDGGWSGTKMHYAHRLAGVCYSCNGTGVGHRYDSADKLVALVKRRRADEARRVRKAEAKAAEQRAAHAEWVAANTELHAELTAIFAELPEGIDTDADYYAAEAANAKWGEFVTQLAAQAQYRPLTDGQVEAVVEAIAKAKDRQAAREAKIAAARYAGEPNAKVTVTGTVTTAMTVNGYMGSSQMLVVIEGTGADAGITVKVTGTGATLWDAERGQSVTVTGTVKAHGEYKGTPQTVLTRAKIKAV